MTAPYFRDANCEKVQTQGEKTVLIFNQKLFQVELSEWLHEHPDKIERFIKLVQMAQANYKKRQQKVMKKHRKITSYFSPRGPLS